MENKCSWRGTLNICTHRLSLSVITFHYGWVPSQNGRLSWQHSSMEQCTQWEHPLQNHNGLQLSQCQSQSFSQVGLFARIEISNLTWIQPGFSERPWLWQIHTSLLWIETGPWKDLESDIAVCCRVQTGDDKIYIWVSNIDHLNRKNTRDIIFFG